MEYSVGSLAELISGINAPNKTKIVKTNIKKEKSDEESNYKNKKGIKHENPIEKKSSQPKGLGKKSISKKRTFGEVDNEDFSFQTPVKKKKIKLNQENVKGTKKSKKNKPFSKTNTPAKSSSASSNPVVSEGAVNIENAVNRIKNANNKKTKSSAEYVNRTVFVGNLPISIKKEKIKKHFKKYGQIEAVRIRGIPVKDLKVSKKVAAIKKEFHPDRNTVYAFIRFCNATDAKKAEEANGDLFEEHHLRVEYCEESNKHDESKAIFIGNLSFDAEEEELWKLFNVCGPISHVRIIRDGRTGMGKGFGYVNFKNIDSVQLALEMEQVSLKNRVLRISLCNSTKAKKKNEKTSRNKKMNSKSKEKIEAIKYEKTNQSSFVGKKSATKKKNKLNKGTKDKKKLAEKLQGKSKVEKE